MTLIALMRPTVVAMRASFASACNGTVTMSRSSRGGLNFLYARPAIDLHAMYSRRSSAVQSLESRTFVSTSIANHSTLSNLPESFVVASDMNSKEEGARVTIAGEEQAMLVRNKGTAVPPCVSRDEMLACNSDNEIAEVIGDVLRDFGVLRVQNILDDTTAIALRAHVNAILDASIGDVAKGSASYLDLFGPIACRTNRCDCLLPMDALVLKAAQTVMEAVGTTLCAAAGPDATVCELTCLISDPGAVAQPVHHDTQLFEAQTRRVTVLVALQDVSAHMGPTCIFPETHTAEWHLALYDRDTEFDELLSSGEHVFGVMDRGDAILYDTNILHMGTANTTSVEQQNSKERDDIDVESSGPGPNRRMLFSISVQSDDDHGEAGSGHTNIQASTKARRYRVADHECWTVE